MRYLALAALVAGCGRYGFDETGDSAPAVSFCASQVPTPLFCRDFDEGAGTSDWTTSVEMFGQIDIDLGAWQSAPASLLATSSATTVIQYASAELTQDLGVMPPRFVASLDLFVDVPGQGTPVYLEVQLDDGSSYHGFEYVDATATTAYIEESNQPHGGALAYNNSPSFPKAMPGAWHRISLDVTPGAGGGVTTSIDGVEVNVKPVAWLNGGQVTVYVGLVYLMGAADPWTVHVDNVMVQAP